ncbi:extracellular solute-binding protein [Vallitalea okinawensis]|uniref:extracellular solute-binding protein n=1 Tax=Vallitalea okinawensis TaxID=2078660 RepID=UPI000CFB94A3|nr:extracellular solute-binding protein [Vallitalea okinawensis]
MKKWGRKSIIFLLVVLIFTLAGCGETESERKSTAETNEEGPVELDAFINFTWYSNEEFKGKIPEKITEKTGVTLNVTKAADEKQLGLMIASEELPDIIFTSKELSRLSNPDVSYSYNELIDKGYMPLFDQGEERIMNAKSFSSDDNFYTILSAYGTKEDWDNSPSALLGGPGLIFRQDIYEELGSPELKTTEDFITLLEMVQEKYPEMRPFMFNPIWQFTPFKVAYGVQADGRYTYYSDNNGGIEFGVRSENYLDFLKYANTLYKKGLMTADNFAVKNESDVIGEFNGGRAFAMTWTDGAVVGTDSKLKQNFPEGKAGLITGLETKNDPILVNNQIGWAGVFISKNCKDPEAAARLVDFIYSQEGRELTCFGIEGEDWNRDENGNIVFSDEIIDIRLNNPNKWEAEWNKGFYFGKHLEENVAFGILADSKPTEVNEMVKESSNYYKEIVDINPRLSLIKPKADTDEKIIYDKLVKLFEDEEAKIIMSETEEELTANYNSMIETAINLGMDDLEQRLTEAYQALN